MAVTNTQLVKFSYLASSKAWDDLTSSQKSASNVIYFVPSEKKIYLDSVPYGASDKDFEEFLKTNDAKIINGDLKISGKLIAEGQAIELNTEKLRVKDNIIELNSNLTDVDVAPEHSGIKVQRGKNGDPYGFVFTDDGINKPLFRIGKMGDETKGPSDATGPNDLQAVMTRTDTMFDQGLIFWDETNKRSFTQSSVRLNNGTIEIGSSPVLDASDIGVTVAKEDHDHDDKYNYVKNGLLIFPEGKPTQIDLNGGTTVATDSGQLVLSNSNTSSPVFIGDSTINVNGRVVGNAAAPTEDEDLTNKNYVDTEIAKIPTGSVSSVAMSMPSIFSVTGSPVTGSGTLTATFKNQAANSILAGPVSGVAGEPSFRTLDSSDIPSLDASAIGSGIFSSLRIPDLNADKITTGELDIARIPTGTGAGQVALGNHNHDSVYRKKGETLVMGKNSIYFENLSSQFGGLGGIKFESIPDEFSGLSFSTEGEISGGFRFGIQQFGVAESTREVVLDMKSHRITGLKTPNRDNQATTKKYVDDLVADAVTWDVIA